MFAPVILLLFMLMLPDMLKPVALIWFALVILLLFMFITPSMLRPVALSVVKLPVVVFSVVAVKVVAFMPVAEIVFAERLPEDAPSKRKPDIAKAQTVLGWTPEVNLEQGLQKLMESLKNG